MRSFRALCDSVRKDSGLYLLDPGLQTESTISSYLSPLVSSRGVTHVPIRSSERAQKQRPSPHRGLEDLALLTGMEKWGGAFWDKGKKISSEKEQRP